VSLFAVRQNPVALDCKGSSGNPLLSTNPIQSPHDSLYYTADLYSDGAVKIYCGGILVGTAVCLTVGGLRQCYAENGISSIAWNTVVRVISPHLMVALKTHLSK